MKIGITVQKYVIANYYARKNCIFPFIFAKIQYYF